MIDPLYGVKCLKLGFDRYSKIGTNIHYVFFLTTRRYVHCARLLILKTTETTRTTERTGATGDVTR